MLPLVGRATHHEAVLDPDARAAEMEARLAERPAEVLALGIGVALTMPKKGWGASFCLVAVAMPLLIPWNVVGTIWTVFARPDIGLAGVFLPDWFIGDNTREYVLITSPAAPGPAHSRESVEQAAVHEYVHVLTDRRNKKLGYWFKEGIALYLAEQKPSRDSLRAVSHITWEEYSRPNALQFARVGGYSLAYTLIEYIIEEHGWEAVIQLVEPGAASTSILGYGERELFERWKAWLAIKIG